MYSRRNFTLDLTSANNQFDAQSYSSLKKYMQPKSFRSKVLGSKLSVMNWLSEVDAPASPAPFLPGTEQEKEVAHCDTRIHLCQSGT